MFLSITSDIADINAFLCLRRGVSSANDSPDLISAFSLPTQRCFYGRAKRFATVALFSAYAEVFPLHGGSGGSCMPFLCLRRGVSEGSSFTFFHTVLFSAYAEVFPDARTVNAGSRAFLCLRRGVSRKDPVGAEADALFSAYAEVFPCESTEWKP